MHHIIFVALFWKFKVAMWKESKILAVIATWEMVCIWQKHLTLMVSQWLSLKMIYFALTFHIMGKFGNSSRVK